MCDDAAVAVSGTCVSGNCLYVMCSVQTCLPPKGSCVSSCSQCSDTYNEVKSDSMTNELCVQICITTYGYKYAATNNGCVDFFFIFKALY